MRLKGNSQYQKHSVQESQQIKTLPPFYSKSGETGFSNTVFYYYERDADHYHKKEASLMTGQTGGWDVVM